MGDPFFDALGSEDEEDTGTSPDPLFRSVSGQEIESGPFVPREGFFTRTVAPPVQIVAGQEGEAPVGDDFTRYARKFVELSPTEMYRSPYEFAVDVSPRRIQVPPALQALGAPASIDPRISARQAALGFGESALLGFPGELGQVAAGAGALFSGEGPEGAQRAAADVARMEREGREVAERFAPGSYGIGQAAGLGAQMALPSGPAAAARMVTGTGPARAAARTGLAALGGALEGVALEGTRAAGQAEGGLEERLAAARGVVPRAATVGAVTGGALRAIPEALRLARPTPPPGSAAQRVVQERATEAGDEAAMMELEQMVAGRERVPRQFLREAARGNLQQQVRRLREAVDDVRPGGLRGIGSGSTAEIAVLKRDAGRRIAEAERRIIGIADEARTGLGVPGMNTGGDLIPGAVDGFAMRERLARMIAENRHTLRNPADLQLLTDQLGEVDEALRSFGRSMPFDVARARMQHIGSTIGAVRASVAGDARRGMLAGEAYGNMRDLVEDAARRAERYSGDAGLVDRWDRAMEDYSVVALPERAAEIAGIHAAANNRFSLPARMNVAQALSAGTLPTGAVALGMLDRSSRGLMIRWNRLKERLALSQASGDRRILQAMEAAAERGPRAIQAQHFLLWSSEPEYRRAMTEQAPEEREE